MARWKIRAKDRVGLVRVGRLIIEVRPKLPVSRLLFMLGYACGIPELRTAQVDASEADDLLTGMAWIYSEALRRALARGLPHGYVQREEDSVSVRGRICFEEQVRRRPGSWLPLAVRFDDFVEDTDLNRTLKAALRRLLTLPALNGRMRLELRRWLRVFAAVSDLPRGLRTLPVVHLTRLEAHLKPARNLAEVILRGGSIEPSIGSTPAPSLFLDLSDLFERFVRESLRQEVGLSRHDFPAAGGGDLYLDTARTVALRPDLLWRESGRYLFVGDVKYKEANDGRGRREDLYQLLTYTIRLNLERGLLIHASPQEKRVHQIAHGVRRLEVVGVDLGTTLDELRSQIESIAVLLRAHASSSRCGAGRVLGMR
jgi:5-methylcytosine-specific restriction enzyme subunit McrC